MNNHHTDKDVAMAVLEDLTSDVKQIQDQVLEEILTCDANTEYLRSFPLGTYEDFKPYIDRVVNGEPSDVISGRPIIGFMLSHVDGHNQGKGMVLAFIKQGFIIPSGLPASYSSTFIMKSDHAKNPASYWDMSWTSPSEVILCPDNKQTLYCHLLCGLVKRDGVIRVGAHFASTLVQGIIFLENFWKEMCNNIRSGQLSDWITDFSCRDSVSMVLGGPNPQLADLIEDICNQKSWKGIIPQLWPKTKFIETVITGQMAQYIPTLEFYVNDLPLVSTTYASSETTYGINLNPLCKPQDVSYTLLPNMSYFEFLPVNGEDEAIVDLVNVKLGGYYEPIVTNYSGHYVLYWELKGYNNNDINELINTNVLVECCSVVEESLDALYRKFRSKDGSIGALEIRVVQQGTFDSVMEYFIAQGASLGQYKTPRCINPPRP